MSSIKSLFEVYRPKPKDEQDFVDKHVVIKHKDKNGNGDDVFNASKVKPVARKKTRLGYDAPEDEKVYEEIDLDEDQMIDAIVEMAELEGVELTDEEIVDILTQVKEGFDPSSEDIAKMLVKKHGKNVTKAHIDDINRDSRGSLDHEEIMQHVKKLTEGYVNLAQQRAVWATRKDGGKGHPDNKKKMKKEEVEAEQSDTMEKTEMAQTQLHFIGYAVKEILDYIKMGGDVEEWYQNKLSKVHSDIESLHSYVEGEKRRAGMVKEDADQINEILKSSTPMKTYIKDFQKSDAPQFKGKSQEKRRQMAIAAKLSNEEVELDEGLMHDRYMRSHGKEARGTGSWAFTTKQYGSPKKEDMHFTSGQKTLSAAHKEAAAKLGTKNLYVMEEVEELDELSDTYSAPARVPQKMIKPEAARRMASTANRKNMSDKDVETVLFNQGHGRKSLKLINQLRKEEVEAIDEAINFTALDAVIKGHEGKSYSATFDAHGSSIHNKIKAVRKERDNQPGTTKHATFLHDKMLQAYASWYKNKKAVKEESEAPFEGPYKKTGTVRKDEYGNVIQNVPRHLANKAMKSLKKEDVINRAIDKYLPEEVKYTLEERFAIKIQNVPEMHHDTLIELFGGLSESNQKSMLLQLSEDDGVSKLLDFAIKNRGE